MTNNNKVEWLLDGGIKDACVVIVFTVFCIAFITCLIMRYIAGCNNNNNNKVILKNMANDNNNKVILKLKNMANDNNNKVILKNMANDNNNKVILKNMANDNKVEWLLNGKIQAACESCKFPRHDGPCGSASSFLNQDEIVTLNIGCEYCGEEFRSLLRTSFPVKLTFEERKPVFHNFDRDDMGYFEGLNYFQSDVKSQIKSLPDGLRLSSPIDAGEFKLQLKDAIHIMSSSGQHLWKTMFGNVEESIQLLWALRYWSSHVFCHQMAYFLSAIDIEDKASFLGRCEMHWIPSRIHMEDLLMLFPSIGFHRIKAMIVNEIKTTTLELELAFLLFVVKNQRELEEAGEFDKDLVGKLACRFGMQYVYVSSHSSKFSLDAFCPLERMKISTPNSSSRFQLSSSLWLNGFSRFELNGFSRFELRPQKVRASVQLVHKKEVHSQNIEVSINVRNVRCHILSDKPGDQEKYFPSRIQIRVIPTKDCEKRTQFLTVGKSSNDASRTLSTEKEWEGGIELPRKVELKKRMKFGSSVSHTNWRSEMNGCLDNSTAGQFEWTLFDNANGVEVWSADSRNYNKLMDRGSSLRNRGRHPSSPFTSDGGCVFSEDLYGQPLIWSLDKRVAGTTSSWRVEMDVWLTYCYNVSRNNCFQTASWSFTGSLEMKL